MSKKEYSLDAPLEELLARAGSRFGGVEFVPTKIGNETFDLLQIKDMPGYIDRLVDRARPGEPVELPIWGKIWPSCLILALFMDRMPLPGGAKILEVGAGGGLNSLLLARRGYKVVLSDYEPDALLFCKINVLKNGLEQNATVRKVDFCKDDLGQRFDCIVGCEVLYKEEHYSMLLDFLLKHISHGPGAEIILALDKKRTGRNFFQLAQDKFRLMKQEVPYKDGDSGEPGLACLYRLGALGDA